MSKGDNRRPRDERVSDEEYSIRWQRTFKQVKKRDGRGPPSRPREAVPAREPLPSCRCGIVGCFFCAQTIYRWAVYFRYEEEAEQLAGEFEKNETANEMARLLRSKGAATRVERIA